MCLCRHLQIANLNSSTCTFPGEVEGGRALSSFFQNSLFEWVFFSWSSYCYFPPLRFCAFLWWFCCLKWSPDIIWKCYLVLLTQEGFNVCLERWSLGRREKRTKRSDKSLESELLSVSVGAMLKHTSKGHLPLILQRRSKWESCCRHESSSYDTN